MSQPIDPLDIILQYYQPESDAFRILLVHSVLVTAKALAIDSAFQARQPVATLDMRFIEEAAMLHDIGVFRCEAPEIGCYGNEPYIRHGIIGRQILEQHDLPVHGLVCERHTGAGLTRQEVIEQHLPLPPRDFLPLSLEEKIICLADRFYLKEPERLYQERTLAEIRQSLADYGAAVLTRFAALQHELLCPAPLA